jgi:hypothetical protein
MFLIVLSNTFQDASAIPLNLKVTICRVHQIISPDGGDVPADYFPRVTIGDNQRIELDEVNGPNLYNIPYIFSPDWVITGSVDYTSGTIPIIIELMDDDPPDEEVDINPEEGKHTIELAFDPNTGFWQKGEVPFGYESTSGPSDGSHDGEGSAEIFFDVQVSDTVEPSKNCGIDTDEDGIPDDIELQGIFDENGNQIANFPEMGADPCRKTIAVEIDYMVGSTQAHVHKPTDQQIGSVINMFNNAPFHPAVRDCPYEGFPREKEGINLIVDVDDKIPDIGLLDFPEDSDTNAENDFYSIKSNNFDQGRVRYFHYSLWGDATTDGVFGKSELRGNDFVVPFDPSIVSRFPQHAKTFAHLLGHNLGLDHGGGDDVNCKPNYLSIMNAMFIPGVILISDTGTGSRILDYSRKELPLLDERHLNEISGIGNYSTGNAGYKTFWLRPGPDELLRDRFAEGISGSSLNWDGSTTNMQPTFENDVTVNLNGIPSSAGLDLLCKGSSLQHLSGFNDWENIDFISR